MLLPDAHQTPGAVSPSATRSRVCTLGYSRHARHVTETTRRAGIAAYGIAWSKHSHFEVDHLIPLELGGSNAITNLWPEPQAPATAATPAKTGWKTISTPWSAPDRYR